MRISLVCSSFFPGSASSPVPCRWSPPSPCARDGRYTVSSPRWVSFFLLGGLWTLNFPFSVDTFVPVASFLGMFLAFYLLAAAFEMYRRSAGRPGVQVAVAAGVILVSFANLFGLMGASGMLVLSALELYLAGWGFVYACISLSVDAPRAELA